MPAIEYLQYIDDEVDINEIGNPGGQLKRMSGKKGAITKAQSKISFVLQA
jgi:hypothetical protein